MAIHSDHHDHWIDGNLEERLLVMAIIAISALSPFVLFFFHW